jgi:DNA-binding PadR family transcriptional regulator
MSIRHAILGYLSWQPATGYDLKRLFADALPFHWSGNNNQIYRTLVELHDEGLVTVEVKQQDSLPARKVYTITEIGRAELRRWLDEAPELPLIRNSFLVQLAWADQLPADELDALLAHYEHELEMQVVMGREQERRGVAGPRRTLRETYLWSMIVRNRVAAYEQELTWVREIKATLRREQGGEGLAEPPEAAERGEQ